MVGDAESALLRGACARLPRVHVLRAGAAGVDLMASVGACVRVIV